MALWMIPIHYLNLFFAIWHCRMYMYSKAFKIELTDPERFGDIVEHWTKTFNNIHFQIYMGLVIIIFHYNSPGDHHIYAMHMRIWHKNGTYDLIPHAGLAGQSPCRTLFMSTPSFITRWSIPSCAITISASKLCNYRHEWILSSKREWRIPRSCSCKTQTVRVKIKQTTTTTKITRHLILIAIKQFGRHNCGLRIYAEAKISACVAFMRGRDLGPCLIGWWHPQPPVQKFKLFSRMVTIVISNTIIQMSVFVCGCYNRIFATRRSFIKNCVFLEHGRRAMMSVGEHLSNVAAVDFE